MAVTAAEEQMLIKLPSAAVCCAQSGHELRRLQQADLLDCEGTVELVCVSTSVWSSRLVVNLPSPGHQLWLVSQTMTGGGHKAAQATAFCYPSISYAQHISGLCFMI